MTQPGADESSNESELTFDAYRILRSEIEHEDQLINHRLSWLVSSQSFLLTAYAICLNAPVEFHAPSYGPIHRILFNLLPYAGLAMVMLIYPSIIGAVIALSRLRGYVRSKIPAGLRPVHGMRLTAVLGLSGPLLIPWVFGVAWTILLLTQ